MAVVQFNSGTDQDRLDALASYKVLDTEPEQEYDDIVGIAADALNCPVALVSLVDAGRLWFKAKVGFTATEISSESSFCLNCIQDPGTLFVVNDAVSDPRFVNHPLVTDSATQVRFYAGMPLLNADNYVLGTLCVLDNKPRELDEKQAGILEALARLTVNQLEMRRQLSQQSHLLAASGRYQRRMQKYRDRLEEQNQELEELSTTDPLSGLANRRGYDQFIEETLESDTSKVRGLCLALLDIDHFKRHNDKNGHQHGDELIQRLAKILCDCVRDSDLVARLGGDEFAIVMPGQDSGNAEKVAERIRSALEKATRSEDQLTVSVGIARNKRVSDTAEDLYERADEALYAAKSRGRDQVVVG